MLPVGTDFMQLLEECIKQLRQGRLTEDRLWELVPLGRNIPSVYLIDL